MARRRTGHSESSTPSGAGGGPAAARGPGEPAPAATPQTPAPRGTAVLTWPREGIPDGQGYLVAPAHPELGTPEVRIAVPDDADAGGEVAALAEALNDPEIAAAVRGDPDAS